MSEEIPTYTTSSKALCSDNENRARKLSERLAKEMGWGAWVIEIAVRAHFRCEYCDRDLLASADTYKEWQHDHIVPQRVEKNDELDNMALSCRTCNVNFKGKWDPRNHLSGNPSREELIQATRNYVAKKRTAAFIEVVKVREIVYGV